MDTSDNFQPEQGNPSQPEDSSQNAEKFDWHNIVANYHSPGDEANHEEKIKEFNDYYQEQRNISNSSEGNKKDIVSDYEERKKKIITVVIITVALLVSPFIVWCNIIEKSDASGFSKGLAMLFSAIIPACVILAIGLITVFAVLIHFKNKKNKILPAEEKTSTIIYALTIITSIAALITVCVVALNDFNPPVTKKTIIPVTLLTVLLAAAMLLNKRNKAFSKMTVVIYFFSSSILLFSTVLPMAAVWDLYEFRDILDLGTLLIFIPLFIFLCLIAKRKIIIKNKQLLCSILVVGAVTLLCTIVFIAKENECSELSYEYHKYYFRDEEKAQELYREYQPKCVNF